MKIAYLACPYSDPDPKIKHMRLTIVTKVAYELMNREIYVYSPLTHNIPIDQLGIHGNWLTWKCFDHAMLSRCDRLIVLKLPGWQESKGVAAEIAHANELKLPIEWMECTEEILLMATEEDVLPYKELLSKLLQFYAERDWNQFHSPKNLSMNLSVESAEIMDHFRWLTESQSFIESPGKLNEIRDEVGDVFLVLIHLAHTLGINPIKAAYDKLSKIAVKYPVDKCKGLCHKYTEYENQG